MIDLEKLTRGFEIIDVMPKPEVLPDGTRLGNYSALLPSKVRLIPYHNARNVENAVGTETQFTRALFRTLPTRKFRRDQYQEFLKARQPGYLRPSIMKDAVYIDIKSAYASIYKVLGWGVEYKRGEYLAHAEPLIWPFSPLWKIGRSYVVSGARPFQFGQVIKNGKGVHSRFWNVNNNIQMVAAVYDILSSVARFAVYACGARYWNVDGGIFPAKIQNAFTAFLGSLGFDWSVKWSGDAEVLSSGYWRVGSHKTQNYAAGKGVSIRQGDWIPLTVSEAEAVYRQYREAVTSQYHCHPGIQPTPLVDLLTATGGQEQDHNPKLELKP